MSTDLHWFKSSHSGDQGECVEIAVAPAGIHIRDSKTPATAAAPTIRLTPTTWRTFLRSLA
ncbi:DUF397 domain-containing protein [Streptomyces sp. NPDC020298]|uniref:DUF397 domain-containing protein n=1 Tax=unclassified Streptomyces TaxID=2593676 RepID=UPI0033D71E75